MVFVTSTHLWISPHLPAVWSDITYVATDSAAELQRLVFWYWYVALAQCCCGNDILVPHWCGTGAELVPPSRHGTAVSVSQMVRRLDCARPRSQDSWSVLSPLCAYQPLHSLQISRDTRSRSAGTLAPDQPGHSLQISRDTCARSAAALAPDQPRHSLQISQDTRSRSAGTLAPDQPGDLRQFSRDTRSRSARTLAPDQPGHSLKISRNTRSRSARTLAPDQPGHSLQISRDTRSRSAGTLAPDLERVQRLIWRKCPG